MASRSRKKKPSNHFAQGGLVIGQSGWNTIGNSSALIRINASGISTGTIKLHTAPQQPEQCKARRGGPSSKIFCVVFKDVPHDIHMGVGRKRWFSWSS